MLSRTGKREVLPILEGRWTVSGDARYSLLPWKAAPPYGTYCQAGYVDGIWRLGKIGETVPLFAHRISIQISGAGAHYLKVRLWGTARRPSDHLLRCNVEQKALAGIYEQFTGHSLYL